MLGNLYLVGKGVPNDDAQAAIWYGRAAAQGDVESQSMLGAMYRMGRGVVQNDVEALKWYQLAASKGNEFAQKQIAEMRVDVAQRQFQRDQAQRDQEQQNRRCNDIGGSAGIERLEAAYAALVASRPTDWEITTRAISQSPITPYRGWAGSAMAGAGASEAVSNAHAEYARADYDHQIQIEAMKREIATA